VKPLSVNSPLSDQFYVKSNGRKLGPLSLRQLEMWERRGQIDQHTLASTDGINWVPLVELEALYPTTSDPGDKPEDPVEETTTAVPGVPHDPGPGPPELVPVDGPRGISTGWIVGGVVGVAAIVVILLMIFSGTEESSRQIIEPIVGQEPPDTKPPDTKPLVTKPLVTKPPDTKPLVTKPVVTKPVVTKPVVTKPVVTKKTVADSGGDKKPTGNKTNGKSYEVSSVLDLSRSRSGSREVLSLRDLPESPKAGEIKGVMLIGADLMDDLVEIQLEDGGRSLLVKGRPRGGDEDDSVDPPSEEKVAIVRFEIDQDGLGARWTSDVAVVRQFRPQLQWCALAVQYSDGRSHYVSLRRSGKTRLTLKRESDLYQATIPLPELTDKVQRRLRIMSGEIRGQGRTVSSHQIVAHGDAYRLESPDRLLATRGDVRLAMVENEDRRKLVLQIRLVPSRADILDRLRKRKTELLRDNSAAKLTLLTVEKGGGGRLASSSSETIRSFLVDTLKVKIPDRQSNAAVLRKFGTTVQAKGKALVFRNQTELKRIIKHMSLLEKRRRELIDSRLTMKLYTVIRDRDTDVRVIRYALLP
jgi:hypothetical protein